VPFLLMLLYHIKASQKPHPSHDTTKYREC
jgi:hypothetical protein